MAKKILILLLVFALLTGTAWAKSGIDDSAIYKEAPDNGIIPEAGTDLTAGLGEILSGAAAEASTSFGKALVLCGGMLAAAMLCGIFGARDGNTAMNLACVLALSALFTSQLSALLSLGTSTIRDLSEYGKVLLPVMAAAMTASGQPSGSAALYLGTELFDTLLITLIDRLLVPLLYVYLALSIANAAVGNETLKRLRDFVKGLGAWGLKIVLYIFTGYMTLTGVISGKADVSAVKATKLAISTAVPVVGGILSDASEAVVLGAETIRGASGLYGALVILGICAVPFLRLGIQYLLLKGTAALCAVIGEKNHGELIDCFSQALGIVLAMTGVCCLIQLISLVCFMKGAL